MRNKFIYTVFLHKIKEENIYKVNKYIKCYKHKYFFNLCIMEYDVSDREKIENNSKYSRDQNGNFIMKIQRYKNPEKKIPYHRIQNSNKEKSEYLNFPKLKY